MWKYEKHQNEAIQISANMQESVAKIMSILDPAIVIACVTELQLVSRIILQLLYIVLNRIVLISLQHDFSSNILYNKYIIA